MTPAVPRELTVCLGEAARVVGILNYFRQGPREASSFAYDLAWLAATDRFNLSPDLALVSERQYRKAPSKVDSVFHLALADTAPDGWGRRVIARDHARRRQAEARAGRTPPAALTELDYLLGVDDVSRVGALRLRDQTGAFLRATQDNVRAIPLLFELQHLLSASRAVELGKESAADLRFLRGQGTSLGGMRPKCSILDDDGSLAIGKFPSVGDDRSVVKGEVLALQLARAAGIDAATGRVVHAGGDVETPVALIRRFDRSPDGGRIPYLSAASMLQASREDERAYTEIADAILASGADPRTDCHELWRRIVFSLLITNVDDHLQNHGFLHVAHGQWRLAPAFDLNPFPDKDRELKLWLTEDSGPVAEIDAVMAAAVRFRLTPDEARTILAEVVKATGEWRKLAVRKAVGMTRREIEDFAPAFEHEQRKAALRWLQR